MTETVGVPGVERSTVTEEPSVVAETGPVDPPTVVPVIENVTNPSDAGFDEAPTVTDPVQLTETPVPATQAGVTEDPARLIVEDVKG